MDLSVALRHSNHIQNHSGRQHYFQAIPCPANMVQKSAGDFDFGSFWKLLFVSPLVFLAPGESGNR